MWTLSRFTWRIKEMKWTNSAKAVRTFAVRQWNHIMRVSFSLFSLTSSVEELRSFQSHFNICSSKYSVLFIYSLNIVSPTCFIFLFLFFRPLNTLFNFFISFISLLQKSLFHLPSAVVMNKVWRILKVVSMIQVSAEDWKVDMVWWKCSSRHSNYPWIQYMFL